MIHTNLLLCEIPLEILTERGYCKVLNAEKTFKTSSKRLTLHEFELVKYANAVVGKLLHKRDKITSLKITEKSNEITVVVTSLKK